MFGLDSLDLGAVTRENENRLSEEKLIYKSDDSEYEHDEKGRVNQSKRDLKENMIPNIMGRINSNWVSHIS